MTYSPPRVLTAYDDVSGVASGNDDLDDWLVRIAHTSQQSDSARVVIEARDFGLAGPTGDNDVNEVLRRLEITDPLIHGRPR